MKSLYFGLEKSKSTVSLLSNSGGSLEGQKAERVDDNGGLAHEASEGNKDCIK